MTETIIEDNNEFYLNIIKNGVSLFSHDFKNNSQGLSSGVPQLEAGLMYSLNDYVRSVNAENGTVENIELIRRKKTLSTGDEIYVDSRITAGESAMLVSHISTGSVETDEGAWSVPFQARRLLSEKARDESGKRINELDSFQPLCKSLESMRAENYEIELMDARPTVLERYDGDTHGKVVQVEKNIDTESLMQNLIGYGKALAQNNTQVTKDEPLMIIRSVNDNGTSGYISSRIFPSENYFLITHAYRSQRAEHKTDEILHDLNSNILSRFESTYQDLMDTWDGNAETFGDFSSQVEEAAFDRKLAFFSKYRQELIFELGFAGLPRNELKKLRFFTLDSKDSPQMFYTALDSVCDRLNVRSKLNKVSQKVNPAYEPVSVVFGVELYAPQ